MSHIQSRSATKKEAFLYFVGLQELLMTIIQDNLLVQNVSHEKILTLF